MVKFNTLHEFSETEGRYPNTIIIANNTLIGANNSFTFSIDYGGTNFRTLFDFTSISLDGCVGNISYRNDYLYGATLKGGDHGEGGVYAINMADGSCKILYSLNGEGKATSGVTIVGSQLFVATDDVNGNGRIICLTIDGTSIETYPFRRTREWKYALISNKRKLFGASRYGGSNDEGTIYSIDLNGSDFLLLHHFSRNSNDAYEPSCPLILNGNRLYGATSRGGKYDLGTIYSINIDGSGYCVLHDFSGRSDGGSNPRCLNLCGDILYVGTRMGGNNNLGAICSFNLVNKEFSLIYSFSEGDLSHLVSPNALISDNNRVLYGVTSMGGKEYYGTIFSIEL